MAALDSAGIPLPDVVDFALIAVAIVKPSVAYFSAALAVVGSVLGCLFLFFIARKGGQLYLDKYAQGAKASKFRAWFGRYGLVTVYVPVLVPIITLPTKVFILCAGALGVRTTRFVLVVLAARVPRYFGLAYLGSQLGEKSDVWLKAHAWHIAGVALGVCVLAAVLVKLGSILLRRVKTGPSS